MKILIADATGSIGGAVAEELMVGSYAAAG